MSFFGKNRRIGTSVFGSIRKKAKGLLSQQRARSKPRRLQIDSLEDRILLSVVPADTQDMLVNQPTALTSSGTVNGVTGSGVTQTTMTGQSVATDDQGDFVVTWTTQDPVTYNGKPVIDPISKQQEMQSNVYSLLHR